MNRLFSIFLTVLLSISAIGQNELDSGFAGDGSNAYIFGAIGTPVDLAVQADNKIVIVAPCFNINLGDRAFCAIRVNQNGSLDDAFRSNPSVLGAYSSFGTVASGIAVQNDGKIIAVGHLTQPVGEDLVMVRWQATGAVDTTFGTTGNGGVLVDVTPGTNDRGKKILVQPDGKILVVGRSASDLFVARFLSGGTLDTNFGVGGIARAAISGVNTIGQSIALQGDGKILAGGASSTAFLLARFNPNGTLDNSWDSDGIATVGSSQISESSGFRSIALQADGRVVALGHSNILYRFNSDGTLDLSFDGDGSRPALIGSLADPYEVVVSPGGLITVVGEKIFIFGQFDTFDYLTARYLPNGAPDTTYGGDGFFDINVYANDGARAAGIDSMGRIVIAGRSTPGTVNFPFENSGYSAARLQAPPGAAVGITGRVFALGGRGVYGAMVTATGGGGVRTAITNPFGYYRLPNLAAGEVYAISVGSKSYAFDTRNVFVGDNVSGVDFVASQSPNFSRTSK